jgi:F-type H+-transporting ATPase subunit a
MSASPFDIFAVKNLWVNKYFAINNIHFGGGILLALFLLIAFAFKRNNFVYNGIFALWKLLYELLEVNKNKNNRQYMPFFATIFLFMMLSNFLARVPGLLPINSLLRVSLPINCLMIFYFFYCSVKVNGTHIVDVFFDRSMLLPIRLLVGSIELLGFFAKIFSFSMRLLANLTAGHVLMWVIEEFVIKMPIYGKILPLAFLILIYLIEMASAALQSYVFIILSVNTFKSIQKPHH